MPMWEVQEGGWDLSSKVFCFVLFVCLSLCAIMLQRLELSDRQSVSSSTKCGVSPEFSTQSLGVLVVSFGSYGGPQSSTL